MIYGYIRVSSDKQSVENQRFEINNFCKRERFEIDGWIEETISGTRGYNDRQLGKLLKKVRRGDLIICAELSRLGRNLFMIMEILNLCMTKECKVWTIKDNYRLGEDIQSKVLAFAFGLSAEIERNLISQRTKEALARKKAEGIPLGRPRGKRNAPGKYKLSGKENMILELLQADYTQMSHHGQWGVSKAFYDYIHPRRCIWPSPDWLWDNDLGEGFDTGPFQTVRTRQWMADLGVTEHFVEKDGIQAFTF